MSQTLQSARAWRSRLKGQLRACFKRNDFRSAHAAAREVLEAVVADEESMRNAFRVCVAERGFLESARINPVLALPLFETPRFTLVANCWFPHPLRGSEISHQSIHHHGNLLLSTIAAFGEGYESVLFEPGFSIDETRRVHNLRVKERYRNSRGRYEFVDTHTPHLVFYPERISVTFALWSRVKPQRGLVARTLLARLGLKGFAAGLARRLGMGASFGVNQDTDLDFAVENGEVVALPERATYPRGDNRSFLSALWLLGQEIGLSEAELTGLLGDRAVPGASNQLPLSQLHVPGANLERSEVLRCLS